MLSSGAWITADGPVLCREFPRNALTAIAASLVDSTETNESDIR